jgi:hypothetical protein
LWQKKNLFKVFFHFKYIASNLFRDAYFVENKKKLTVTISEIDIKIAHRKIFSVKSTIMYSLIYLRLYFGRIHVFTINLTILKKAKSVKC